MADSENTLLHDSQYTSQTVLEHSTLPQRQTKLNVNIKYEFQYTGPLSHLFIDFRYIYIAPGIAMADSPVASVWLHQTEQCDITVFSSTVSFWLYQIIAAIPIFNSQIQFSVHMFKSPLETTMLRRRWIPRHYWVFPT